MASSHTKLSSKKCRVFCMGRPKKEDREDAEFAAAAAGDPTVTR